MRSIRLEKHLALGNYSFCPIISPVQFTNAKLKLNIDIVSMDPPVQTTQKFLTFALFAFIWCIPFKCNEGFYFLDAISKITPQTESLRMYAARTEIIGIQGTYNSVSPWGYRQRHQRQRHSKAHRPHHRLPRAGGQNLNRMIVPSFCQGMCLPRSNQALDQRHCSQCAQQSVACRPRLLIRWCPVGLLPYYTLYHPR